MNNKSHTLHNWSIVCGVLGIIGWGLGGLSQLLDVRIIVPFWHYWVDGGIFLLVAIWLSFGAMYHRQ